MKKVIYFDESSALDILDLKNEGRAEEIMKNMVEKANNISADGKIGTGILDLFNLGVSANGKGGASRKKSNVLTTISTNTILTSFNKLLTEEKGTDFELCELENYDLMILPESATFIKSVTPFVKIFNNNENQSDSQDPFSFENINLNSLDEVMLDAKGYYELIAEAQNTKKVVRFNLDGFRNNYKLNDLQKMNLTMYGVKVGKCSEESLTFDNEIGGEVKSQPQEANPTGFDPHKHHQVNNNKELDYEQKLDIIDIVLAGIK